MYIVKEVKRIREKGLFLRVRFHSILGERLYLGFQGTTEK